MTRQEENKELILKEMAKELRDFIEYARKHGVDIKAIKSENPDTFKKIFGEPCTDAISRQAVLEALRTMYDTHIIKTEDGDEYIDYNDTVYEIEALPSVNPQEPKTGHWIFHTSFDKGHKNCNECIECSQCHTWLGHDCYAKTPYCPICGTKMAESEVADADSN